MTSQPKDSAMAHSGTWLKRDQNFQKISWFWDHFTRHLLNLDPPYQRRSVWNQEYKDYFVDTILLGYPAPAIFLYEETDPSGRVKYNVVDGKQRLTSIFEFLRNQYPVADNAELTSLRGKYFQDLDDDTKVAIWTYKFSVESLPTADEKIINTIFDRINRNVAKLSRQELRHARYSGEFIAALEELTDWWASVLPENFPRLAEKSRRQMKDVEFTAELVLYLELGPVNLSQDDLDVAFSERDAEWEPRREIETRFRRTIHTIQELIDTPSGATLPRSRLRNQADFFSLFATVDTLLAQGERLDLDVVADRLVEFIGLVEDARRRSENDDAQTYYDAARSASNDPSQRQKRIRMLKNALTE